MNLLRLSWRNLWRNRRRTLITLLAMALSLMLIQAFHNLSTGVYQRMIDSGVKAGSGHIALYHRDYPGTRSEALSFAPEDLVQQLSNLPGIRAALPRLYLPALAQSSRESRGILLIGLDAEKEQPHNPYLKELPESSRLRPGNLRDALLGKKLMEELQLKDGQKFVVRLQSRSGEMAAELFRVRGILETGIPEVDRATIMVNRPAAERLAGMENQIHELALILGDPQAQEALLPQVRAMVSSSPEIRALGWEEAMPNLANAIRLDYASQKVIFAIILIIVGIGVINTLLMSVMERIREFGVMLALGMRPRDLASVILLEGFLLGVVSAILGSLFGVLATWYLKVRGIDLRAFISESIEVGGVVFDPVLRARWDLPAMAWAALFMVLLCTLAAIYPARKAARTAPATAMRHV